MKGWILVNSASYKELPLTEEQLSNLGIEIVFCEDIDFIVDSHSDGTVLVKGEVTTLPDFVLAAFLLEDKYKPFAVLMQLESLGVICINNVNSLDLSKDKVKTSQVLASCGLPVPKTIYCNKNNINYNFIEQNIQYPMVVKIIDGTQGKGVFLVNNIKEAQDVISKMDTNDVIFQEYISTSFGRDIRVSVFVGKVVKIVGRESQTNNEFRSNIHLGGKEVEVKLTPRIIELAEKMYKATGIKLCGMDLLYNGDDYVICELNSVPGGLNDDFGYTPIKDILQGIKSLILNKTIPLWKINNILKNSTNSPLFLNILKESLIDRYKIINQLSNCSFKVQKIVLESILENGNKSLFAKEHSFDKIKDIDSFRKHVPISNWSDYSNYIEKLVSGESNVLFNGNTESFILTSGTTSKPKMIPESDLGKEAKGFVTSVKQGAIAKNLPSIIKSGGILPIVVPYAPVELGSGIKSGSASYMALEKIPMEMQNRLAYPVSAMKIKNTNLIDYIIIRCAIEKKDMALIAGNNAVRMSLLVKLGEKFQDMIISDIENGTISFPVDEQDKEIVNSITQSLRPNIERAKELKDIIAKGERFIPKYYWPELKIASFWLSASIGITVPQLRALLPETTKFIDTGYGASELKINIPLSPEHTDGLLSTTTAFYEFVHIEDEMFERPLLANQLNVGQEYLLIVTTYSGLWRYNMNDVVKCTGYVGDTPMLEFVRKGGDVSNLHGEKLPASALMVAINEALGILGMNCKAVQVFPDASVPRYNIYLEANKINKDLEKVLEESLKNHHWSYNKFRDKKILMPLSVTFMKKGWQQELYNQKKANSKVNEAQIKLPLFIHKRPLDIWYES